MRQLGPDVGAVVALKSLQLAKSRLQGLPDAMRRRLVQTMAADTLAALTEVIPTVVVVSGEPSLQGWLHAEGIPALVVGEPADTGMNTALRHGDQLLRDRGIRVVLACVADLPGLRGDAVAMIVTAARGIPRTFLADAGGTGTTMVIADGVALDPRFEGASAAAHRSSGAVPATELIKSTLIDPALINPELINPELIKDARRDVDTVADLYAVGHLGPRTAALIDPGTGRLGHHQVITTAGGDQVITASGHRLAFRPGPGLWQVRRGQRLHASTNGERVLAAWI